MAYTSALEGIPHLHYLAFCFNNVKEQALT